MRRAAVRGDRIGFCQQLCARTEGQQGYLRRKGVLKQRVLGRGVGPRRDQDDDAFDAVEVGG
ncbi:MULTISPECIES: hypothetical protein [unclassified Streptomyces]|uniref:hypothetical protein n=1 Tax=Streptomyces sp. NPDC127129 TaxID=3345373 RepID=UPI00364595BB